MPRSHRHRDRRDDDDEDLTRLLSGFKRTETRRGAEWNVQPISAAAAVKTYVCPACGQDVPPGSAHVVVWKADGILGDASDLAGRRHWHTYCWRTW
jgi:hypothetical protein